MESWIAARSGSLWKRLMSASSTDIDLARSIVATALAVNIDCVGSDTSLYDISAWDSLGQLSIVLAVEEALDVKVVDESTFELLTCVRTIATYISKIRRAHETV